MRSSSRHGFLLGGDGPGIADIVTAILWSTMADRFPALRATPKAVVDYETKVAEASWTKAERRDRDKTYNPTTVAEAQRQGASIQADTSALIWKAQHHFV